MSDKISMRTTVKKWKVYCGAILLLLCFSAGYSLSKNSWDGQFFIYLDKGFPSINSRNIAGTARKHLVKGKRAKQNPQQALIRSSRVEHKAGAIELYLGHLLVRVPGGSTRLACQEYQTVDLTFIAPEISSHGHVPKMVLKTKCPFDPHKDPLQTGPFVIPKKKILSSSVDTALFRQGDTTVLFSYVFARWPEKWILSEARFIKDDTHKDFTVSFSSNREEDFLNFRLR